MTRVLILLVLVLGAASAKKANTQIQQLSDPSDPNFVESVPGINESAMSEEDADKIIREDPVRARRAAAKKQKKRPQPKKKVPSPSSDLPVLLTDFDELEEEQPMLGDMVLTPGFDDEAFWMSYKFANGDKKKAPVTVEQEDTAWQLKPDVWDLKIAQSVGYSEFPADAGEKNKIASQKFIDKIEQLGAQTDDDRNVYLIIGSASGGYNEDTYEGMMQRVKEWADQLDERHGNGGWLFATNGDGYYGHVSLESIASYLANVRKIKGIVVQSNCYHAAIGTPYYPSYASAAIFGPTVKNVHTDGDVLGGFADDEDRDIVSFPDSCFIGKMGMRRDDFNAFESYGYPNLAPYFAGIIAGGGGPIAKQQFEVLEFGTHDNDLVIYTKEGSWKGNQDGVCEVAEYVTEQVENGNIPAANVFDFEQMEAAKSGNIPAANVPDEEDMKAEKARYMKAKTEKKVLKKAAKKEKKAARAFASHTNVGKRVAGLGALKTMDAKIQVEKPTGGNNVQAIKASVGIGAPKKAMATAAAVAKQPRALTLKTATARAPSSDLPVLRTDIMELEEAQPMFDDMKLSPPVPKTAQLEQPSGLANPYKQEKKTATAAAATVAKQPRALKTATARAPSSSALQPRFRQGVKIQK